MTDKNEKNFGCTFCAATGWWHPPTNGRRARGLTHNRTLFNSTTVIIIIIIMCLWLCASSLCLLLWNSFLAMVNNNSVGKLFIEISALQNIDMDLNVQISNSPLRTLSSQFYCILKMTIFHAKNEHKQDWYLTRVRSLTPTTPKMSPKYQLVNLIKIHLSK